MERTLADDLRWALFVLTGAIIGFLVFADGDGYLLLGSFIGIVLVLVGLNVIRLFWRRRNPRAGARVR
jgi:hypothetical protein